MKCATRIGRFAGLVVGLGIGAARAGDRLGLPIGGIVALLLLLMRLGLLNFGERSSGIISGI